MVAAVILANGLSAVSITCMKDVFALPARGGGERAPGRRLSIALDQPCQRTGGRRALLRLRPTSDGRLVLGGEFRGAKFRPHADTWSLADAHVPNSPAVSGDLTMQVRRARAWHGVHHRTISFGIVQAQSSRLWTAQCE